MERKFQYGIWKMPEWNGMGDFKKGMEDNLPSILSFQFHTGSRAWYLLKKIQAIRISDQARSQKSTINGVKNTRKV